jgi:anti-sigma B factor antagonist
MSVNVRALDGGIGLIEVRGSLLGGSDLDELRTGLSRAMQQGTGKLVIDLGQVTFVNSAAVGVLVSALISCARRNWQLRLCGENKVVYTVFKITKLNLVFRYYDTREEAIRSFE